ncbi:MAG: hypothetical protein K1000chlam2_00633 [Chlamydiae bacterium]|nr:hypothetical protein [Chlamydiota bacterium]
MSSKIEMSIPETNLFIPNQLNNVEVKYKDHDFFVIHQGKSQKVENYQLSKELRGITLEQLEKCLDVAYLSLSKIGKDYAIECKLRMKGGGPLFGAIGYWATKTLCYGTAVGAGTAAVIATGGAAAGVGGAAAAAAASVGTASLGTGVGVVAANAASAGGVIAAVETASAAVGAILTAIPFLP